jgi:hypothetical protein
MIFIVAILPGACRVAEGHLAYPFDKLRILPVSFRQPQPADNPAGSRQLLGRDRLPLGQLPPDHGG